MMTRPLDLRPGARVRLLRSGSGGEWAEARLIRPSTTNEEWLVEDRVGRYWVAVNRLRPADGPQPETG
jgi:hypothetical protein